jgi:hypothetical protein
MRLDGNAAIVPGAPVRRRAGAAAAALAVLVCLAACSATPPVHVDPSSLADFGGYHTFAWLAEPPEPHAGAPESPVQLFGWRMRTAVDNGLRGRGYAVDADAPDLLVAVRVTIDERYTETIGDYFRYRDIGGSQNLFSAFSLGYEEAKLVVEVFDARSRQLVWRGHTAVSMDAAHRGDRAAANVAALMQTFPRGANL